MQCNRSARILLALFTVLAIPARFAYGASTQVQVLIDSDNNVATGCSVTTSAGTFNGVDQIVSTTYDTAGGSLAVTGVTSQLCVGGSFGPAAVIDGGGWPVGSAAGFFLLETHIGMNGGPMRLGFTVTFGSLSDSVLTQPNGAPIIFPPIFGEAGKHRVVRPPGPPITLDGNGSDWAGIPPLVASAAGNGSPALRFLEIYATDSAADIFFRFDIQANANAPTANNDSYSMQRGGTLTVPAPGVLANDSDPASLPLTAVLVSGPQHGTLTLNPNGGFMYVNDGSAAPTDTFSYKANNGTADSNTAVVTLTIISGTPPAITSANHATFTVGAAGTFTVTATGSPSPTVIETGALPAGVNYNAGTHVLSGTPAAGTGGTYSIVFIANNIAGSAAQTFTLTINEAVAITSANATSFVAGSAGSFTVTTSGFPRPAIGESGALPAGVTYTDLGNGTGRLAGTPGAATGGVYNLVFSAANGGPVVTQNFTMTINQAPAITSANSTTFTVGSAGTFALTATGFPAPVLGESGALPGGVTFIAATGVLSGTPAAGSGGTYVINFSATNVAGTASQTFTLTVNEAPSITSANATTFTVGPAGTFTVTASGFPAPTIAIGGAPLPAGVTYNPATHVLSGTPGAGTGGTYSISFTANNGIGAPANQPFTLTVNQAPAITSTNAMTFTTGAAGTFTLTATGFPAPVLGESGALPGGVTFVAATGVLSGTPAAGSGGTYVINFSATNVAGTANQTFTLTVNEAPSITSANSANFVITVPATFTITTTGFPHPTIGEGGALPAGVTFTDNGNGTATIAGTPTAGSAGTYVLTITATNVVTSANQTLTLTVWAPPLAVADSYQAAMNTPLIVAFPGVLGNDTVNGATITGNTNPAHGIVTLNANGSFTYTPSAGYTGPDSFNYTLGNIAGSSSATVSLTVFAAPVATADSYQVAKNTPRTLTAPGVLGNDTVNAATIASYGATTGAEQTTIGTATPTSAGGTIALNANGSFTYTPPSAVFTGPDTFKYILLNFAGNSTATVTITVVDVPVAVNDSYSTNTNTPLAVGPAGVLTNDTLNGATLTSYGFPNGTEQATLGTSTATQQGGTVFMNANGSFTYTPAAAFTGNDTFKYIITNLTGSSTATVTVVVATPPTAVNDTATAGKNIALNVVAPGVLGNDTLNAAAIVSYGATTGAEQTTIGAATATSAGGSVTLNANGSYSYLAALNFVGTDTFKYIIQNAGGSSTATVTITVLDVPVAVPDSYFAGQNTPLITPASGVLTNDTLNSATIFSYGASTGAEQTTIGLATPTSAGGSIVLNASGSFTYAPASGFTGADSFKYVLKNVAGTSTATVSITVVPPPAAVADSYFVAQSSTKSVTAPGLESNDTVPAGTTVAQAGATAGTQAATPRTFSTTNGSVTVNTDGSFSYTPTTGFVGSDSFVYTLTDAAGSSTATVSLTVQVPAFANAKTLAVTGNVGISVPAPGVTGTASCTNACAADTGTSIALTQAGPTAGTQALVPRIFTTTFGSVNIAADGSFTYTPVANFTAGTDSFAYTIANGLGSSTATITLTVANRIIVLDSSFAGNGTVANPCGNIACVSAQGAIGAGNIDLIYVVNRGAIYSSNLTMNTNQFMIGGGVSGSAAAALAGITLAANSNALPAATSIPTLTNGGAGATVALASAPGSTNTLDFVNLDATSSGEAVSCVNTVGLTMNTVAVTASGSASGLVLSGNPGPLTWTTGSITISASGSTGYGLNVSGGNGSMAFTNVPISVNASNTGAVSALAVLFQNRTGGIVSFDPGSTITVGSAAGPQAAQGVLLTNNTGATIAFQGRIAIWTSAAPGPAFSATGGGTVTATDPTSTIDAVSGPAITITNTTIGASNLTFESVSANGGSKGISLNNTGGSGGLVVTGAGGLCDSTHTSATDCTGGTIQNMTARGAEFITASNITLNDMYFKTDGTTSVGAGCVDNVNIGSNVTCNAAIHLQTATAVTLNELYLNGTGSAEMGLNGNAVSGLTINPIEIANFAGNQKDAAVFENLAGTVGITNMNEHNNALAHNFSITNNTGTANITFTAPTIQNSPLAATGNADGILALAFGAATTLNVTVNNGTFNNIIGNTTQWGPDAGAHMTGVLNGGTSTGTGGIYMFSQGTNTQMNYTITGLTSVTTNSTGSNAISVGRLNGTNVTENGTISSNTINTGSSACSTCSGIVINSQSASGLATISVTGNSVSGNNFNGLNVTANSGASHLNLTVQGNSFSTTQAPGTDGYAIDISTGGTGTDTNCLFLDLGDMSVGHTVPANQNNITPNIWLNGPGGNNISLVSFDNTTFKLANYTGANDAAAAAWSAASNTNGGTDAFSLGLNQFSGGAICP